MADLVDLFDEKITPLEFDTPEVEPIISDSSSNNEQEILNELTRLKKDPKNSIPFKPNKWNDYDTRTPVQVLEEELIKVRSGQDKQTPLNVGFTPKEKLQPDLAEEPLEPLDFSTGPAPDTANYLAHAATKSLGGVASGLATTVGGVAGLVSERAGEAVMGLGKDIKDLASNSWGVTPEQEVNATYGQKASGALVGAAVQIPMFLTGGPILPLLNLVGNAVNVGTELVDQGVDADKATTLAFISGGANAALFKVASFFPSAPGSPLPEVLKKYAYSVGAGAGTNVVQGAGEDFAAREILKTDYPHIAKNYDPTSWEKRSLDAISGGVLSAGMKYGSDHGTKTSFEKGLDAIKSRDESTAELMEVTMKKVGENILQRKAGFNVVEEADGVTRTEPVDSLRAMDDSFTNHSLVELDDIKQNSNGDLDDFMIRAEALSQSPSWKEFIAEHGPELFNDPTFLNTESTRAKTLIDQGSVQSKDHLTSYGNLDDFFTDKSMEFIKATDLNLDIYGKALGPDQIKNFRVSAKEQPLLDLLRVVYRKQQSLNEMEAKMYTNIMQHTELLKKLPETEQRGVMDLARAVDGSSLKRQEMIDQGIWWPNRKMIDEMNDTWKLKLNEAQKLAYLDMGMLVERSNKIIEVTARKQGKEPPPRIPGYMPHIWKGAYKVHVEKMVGKDQSGREQWRTVRLESFTFKQQAKNFANRVNNRGGDFRVKANNDGNYYQTVELRDFESGIIPVMMQDLDAYRNFSLLDPEAKNRVLQMDSENIQGFNSHLIEGHSVEGFLDGSKKYSIGDIVTGKRYRDNRDFLNLYETYAKRVVESYKNTVYTDEVVNKLRESPVPDKIDPETGLAIVPEVEPRAVYGNLMSRFPAFERYFSDLSGNYTGNSYNHFKQIDAALVDLSTKAGVPPYAYRQIIKSIRNIMSIVFTRYNPGNWAMNYVQPTHTFSILSFVDGLRKDQGLSTYSLHKVIQEVTTGFKNNQPELLRAIAWARENHVLDAQAEYQMRSKATTRVGKVLEQLSLGNVPTKIEADARELSYAIAYTYYKNVIKDPVLARRGAAEVMGSTMVNYDRSRRPLMFQSFGSVGELLSPFAVFRNAYAGNTAMMVKYALSNPKKFHAWKPFLVMQTTLMAYAGLIGAVGFSEYDAIVRLLKEQAPEAFGDWNDSYALMMKAKVPPAMRVGLISSVSGAVPPFANGAAVQGSGSAVGADDIFSPNVAPFLSAMIALTGVASKYATGRSVTSTDKWEAVSGLFPGQAKFAVERYLQEKGSSVSLAPGRMSGAIERDKIDEMTIALLGKESTRVNEMKSVARQSKAIKEQQLKGLKKATELAVDRLNGTNMQDLDALYVRVEKLYGTTSSEFDELIAQKQLERATSSLVKSLSGEESWLKNKIFEETKKILDGRRFTR